MEIITTVLLTLIALLHIYFLVLKMFLWDKPFGRKIFGLTAEFAKESKTLAANQGLYRRQKNIVYSSFTSSNRLVISVIWMIF